jgi:hypothetical protein
MSKAFFRYLRGEINGWWLTRLHNTLNVATEEIKDFLVRFRNMQFRNGSIDDKSLYGLGNFAGIFYPRLAVSDTMSSIRMTDSHIKEGEEVSESGLFDLETETFGFPDFAGDINNLATEDNRSSLVGDEAVQGYISSLETDVIDDMGSVRPEKVLPSPPQGGEAYSEFYGNQFLFLSEGEQTYVDLIPSLYIELFKAVQWVRYNGVSVASLARIIALICPAGLVTIQGITVNADGRHLNVTYVYDEDAPTNLKQQRLSLLEYIIGMKFPQVELTEYQE